MTVFSTTPEKGSSYGFNISISGIGQLEGFNETQVNLEEPPQTLNENSVENVVATANSKFKPHL